MGRNLSNLYISSSFQFLTQISGSELQTGLGDKITGSLDITSSKADTATSASFASTSVSSSYSTTALSASYAAAALSSSHAINADSAATATSASFASTATSASYSTNALSSSFATTASYALNVPAFNTSSLMVTGSVNSNTLTFTKGDGSTFNLTVDTGSAVTVNTGSLLVTASSANDTITYTKGDGSTFTNVINNVSASISASYATTAATAITASYVASVVSASYAATASYAESGFKVGQLTIKTPGATNNDNTIIGRDAGFKISSDKDSTLIGSNAGYNLTGTENVAVGLNALFGQIGADSTGNQNTAVGTNAGVQIKEGSGNVALGYNAMYTIADFPPGADASYNTVVGNSAAKKLYFGDNNTVIGSLTGQLLSTGSNNTIIGANYSGSDFNNTVVLTDGQGNVQFYATGGLATLTNITASSINAPSITGSLLGTASFALTASYALNGGGTINTSSFATTGSNTFIGSETISGSLNVSGSVTGNVLGNNTDTYTSSAPIQQVVTLTAAEYTAISASANPNTFYVISDSTAFNPANYATTGSNTFVGNQTITGSVIATTGFTGSLLGTASIATTAVTASYVLNAVSASYATSASYTDSALSSSYALTASFVTTAQTASYYDLSAVTQNAVFSGSVRGDVSALTISSQTASLDLSTGNFFTVQLVSGSNTYINPSNIQPGQTVNIRVNTTGSGTVSFPSSVLQASGSTYVPTTTTGVDIVTLISFDASSLYLSNVKNLI
jgi:hypothetical protein